jgi:tRNA A37 threonylcarbamoyladenosine biosynthesis protein TsaE
LDDKKGVLAIEWPQIAENLLPQERVLKIAFELISENTRKIKIEWKDKRYDYLFNTTFFVPSIF